MYGYTMTTSPITIKSVEKPTTQRPAEPNPFDDVFPTDDGQAVAVEVPYGTDDDTKALNKIVGQAQTAARNAGYTARKRIDVAEDGKTAVLTFWSVTRIKHRSAEQIAADEQAAAAEKAADEKPKTGKGASAAKA